jgi:hypothetical protein
MLGCLNAMKWMPMVFCVKDNQGNLEDNSDVSQFKMLMSGNLLELVEKGVLEMPV